MLCRYSHQKWGDHAALHGELQDPCYLSANKVKGKSYGKKNKSEYRSR